jgi:hypothetical protein
MERQSAWQLTFGFFPKIPVVVEPTGADLSSDGRLVIFRQHDEQRGLTQRFAEDLTEAPKETLRSVVTNNGHAPQHG